MVGLDGGRTSLSACMYGGPGRSTMSEAPTVLFLCTGNAARSVMAAAMLRHHDADVAITSAGTHSIPGLPMSTRTRTALAGHHVIDRHHRSSQLDQQMVDEAAVIAVFEPMHLRYMRKKHPEASDRVASLPRLARDLADGEPATLTSRVAELVLAEHEFEDWEEVIDPAGGDLAVFEAAAAEIDRLVRRFCPKVGVRIDART